MKDDLPSLDEIRNVMQDIAKENGILEQVDENWDHSTCVWKFADKIAKLAIKNGHEVDLNFLKVACYVHDIGRMKTGSKSLKELEPIRYHGLRGYEIVKKQGWLEKLARVCVRHMGGAGQTKDVNKEIGLGNKDTLAETIEERILAYADCRAFFDEKLGRAKIEPFEKAYNKFKIYPGAGGLLKKNQEFIKKITANKIS